MNSPNEKDDAIRMTDTDAAMSRLSAIKKGYLDDKYTSSLISRGKSQSRPPLINRGTHVRAFAVDNLVKNFLSKFDSNTQIISIGAGSDSRFWRIKVTTSVVTFIKQ